MKPYAWLVAFVVVLGGTACRDASDPTAAPANVLHELLQAEREVPPRVPSVWARMDDAELARAVAAVGGRVLIGVKSPGASRGVYRGLVVTPQAAIETAAATLVSHGVTVLRRFELSPSFAAVIDPARVGPLRRLPFVDYLEPVARGRWLQTTPWNIERVRAPYAWSLGTGSGVDVLVIDTGMDTDHPDLDPASAYACNGGTSEDSIGHGTFVAGIVAAVNDSWGIVGVGPGVNLRSVNVAVDGAPDGEAVVCALQYARSNDFFAINMSISLSLPDTTYDAVQDELEAAWSEGHVLVAAAGNQGYLAFPASAPEVIAVVATDEDNDLGIGPEDEGVELAAPGCNIMSTELGGTIGTDSICATSYAAPHVAAAAAVVKSYYTGWSNAQVRERLQQTAVDLPPSGRDDTFGYGLLDVAAALGIARLDASISGPSEIKPDDECTWSAMLSGGLSPFTYSWAYDGQSVGTSSSWTGGWDPGDLDDEFRLTLSVWDDAGQSTRDSILVTADSSAFACPMKREGK